MNKLVIHNSYANFIFCLFAQTSLKNTSSDHWIFLIAITKISKATLVSLHSDGLILR